MTIYVSHSVAMAQDDVQKIESRKDHFRLTGEVEFDGERIVYDEIIQVRIDVGAVFTLGLKKGDNRVLLSRRWVTRPVQSSGALIMEVPQGAGLFTDLERNDQPSDPKWTPKYIEHYKRPPDEYLPEFYWVDNVDQATKIEAYLAESYYTQSVARLRVVRPIRIEFVPPTPEADQRAIAQMESERPVNFDNASDRAWNALVAVSIPLSGLVRLPEQPLIELARLVREGQQVIPVDLSGTLWDYAHHELGIAPNYRSRGYGVPQPKKYPDGRGRLYRQSIPQSADAIIPVDCHASEGRCVIRHGEFGYAIFRRQQFAGSTWTIVSGTQAVKIEIGQGILDRTHQRILLIGLIHF